MLATILTFSCSSGDDKGGDNGSVAGLPDVLSSGAQVYSDGEKFTGNGNVAIVVNKYDDNTDELLYADTLHNNGTIQNGKVTLNLTGSVDSKYLEELGDSDVFFAEGVLIAIVSDDVYCYLELEIEDETADLVYFSKSGSYKGISFSKGWNFLYDGKGTLTWNMECK